MKRESRAPLIVTIVPLLLPLLYVGSYLALVVPGSMLVPVTGPIGESGFLVRHYHHGGDWAERAFWPLEQIDRKARPWEPTSARTRLHQTTIGDDGLERIGIDFD